MGSFYGLDAEHQRELDYLEIQIEIDDEIDYASMQFEGLELLDEAEMCGEAYTTAYEKGFWDAIHLYEKYDIEVKQIRNPIAKDKLARLQREAEERQALNEWR